MSSFILFQIQRAQYSTVRMRIAPSLFSYSTREIHSTSPRSEKTDDISQGHATNPKNVHQQDVQSQSMRGGLKARKDETNESIDAAHECRPAGKDTMPRDVGKGNPEKIGFVDQVGGASASARKFEREEK